MDKINSQLNTIILIILSISTLIQVADMVGIIPQKIRKKLKQSHVTDTLDVLKELGVDIDRYQRNNIILDYPVDHTAGSVEDCVKKALDKTIIQKKVSVSYSSPIQIQSYIDLIGYTCNQEYAVFFAQQLCNYLAVATRNKEMLHPSFDFIVTPKEGSPILGYELANLLNKPLVLHESKKRFIDVADDFRQYFDCEEIPHEGSTFLIADDSVTAGTKILATIEDLRRFGYGVYDCMIVFELTNVNGRENIAKRGVNLLSIVKVHQ